MSLQSPIIALTKENAEAALSNSSIIFIVDFYADWCSPCKTLKPIFEEVAFELKDQYAFATINFDECPEIASHYQIKSLPTIAIFSNGKMIEKIEGLVPKERLFEKIEAAIRGPQDLSNLSQADLNNKLIQAIQYAAKPEEIKRLLVAGADVNYKMENGAQPLLFAIMFYGSRNIDASEIIALLLEYGAQTEFEDPKTGKKSHAAQTALMMSQNLKKMAENYDKMAALLEKKEVNTPGQCSGNSCTL